MYAGRSTNRRDDVPVILPASSSVDDCGIALERHADAQPVFIHGCDDGPFLSARFLLDDRRQRRGCLMLRPRAAAAARISGVSARSNAGSAADDRLGEAVCAGLQPRGADFFRRGAKRQRVSNDARRDEPVANGARPRPGGISTSCSSECIPGAAARSPVNHVAAAPAPTAEQHEYVNAFFMPDVPRGNPAGDDGGGDSIQPCLALPPVARARQQAFGFAAGESFVGRQNRKSCSRFQRVDKAATRGV